MVLPERACPGQVGGRRVPRPTTDAHEWGAPLRHRTVPRGGWPGPAQSRQTHTQGPRTPPHLPRPLVGGLHFQVHGEERGEGGHQGNRGIERRQHELHLHVSKGGGISWGGVVSGRRQHMPAECHSSTPCGRHDAWSAPPSRGIRTTPLAMPHPDDLVAFRVQFQVDEILARWECKRPAMNDGRRRVCYEHRIHGRPSSDAAPTCRARVQPRHR